MSLTATHQDLSFASLCPDLSRHAQDKERAGSKSRLGLCSFYVFCCVMLFFTSKTWTSFLVFGAVDIVLTGD
jgi:hypothetical protein